MPDLQRNPGSEKPREESISSLFTEVAGRYPNQTAVKTTRQAISYEELNHQSTQLGNYLVTRLGAEPRPIALLFEDGADMITSLLGVIRSGHFYCGLSGKDSQSRSKDVLGHLHPSLLITERKFIELAKQITPAGCETILLSDVPVAKDDNLPKAADPKSLLGIFYTSGSTGEPKGVLRTHDYVLHRVGVDVQDYGSSANDRLLYIRQFNASSSLSSIFDTLLTGGTLYPYDFDSLGISRLADELNREKITIFTPPIEVMRHFLDILTPETIFPSIRCVILAGDVLFRRDVERLREHLSNEAVIIHHLSSSESGLLARSILKHATPLEDDIVPLGFPVPGKEILIINPQTGGAVPRGEPGEITIRSEVIFPGYWQQSELSEKKFRPDPENSSRQVFCTGDLGYFRPDGQLVFLGREDFRVKVRGFSIDLASIESTLMSDHEVKRAVATMREDPKNKKRVIAYVALTPESKHTSSTLRELLKKRLPEYMVPSLFVFLPEFPLTKSHKVDRKALPEPDWDTFKLSSEYASPQDEVERRLTEIWQNVLEVEKIGIDDHLFEIGGDSLIVMTLILEIARTIGVQLPAQVMIAHDTVRELAPFIRQPQLINQEMIVELSKEGMGTPVFIVPGGSGEIYGMLPLAKLLEGKQPIYGLQASGVGGKHLYKQPLEQIAREFIGELRKVRPAGPYRLIGGSFGGVVAYEMARQLTAEGEKVDLLGMIDSIPPGPRRKAKISARLRIHLDALRERSIKEYPAYLMDWWKIFLVGLARRKFFRKIFTFKRLDTAIQGTNIERAGRTAYTMYDPEPYGGTAVLFKAKDKPWYVDWEPLEAWKKYILGEIIEVEVEGTHGSVYKHPQVEGLARAIRAQLE